MNKINNEIKAYFLDLDGTLLDEKITKRTHRISDANREAIEYAKKNKKHIIISTGRIGPYIKSLVKELGLDYAVTGNGAIVINKKGQVLKSVPIQVRQFLLLLDIVKKYSLCMKIDKELDAFGTFTWFDKIITKKLGFIPIANYNCEMHVTHYKVVIWGKTKWKLKKIQKELLESIEGLSIVSSANGWTLEITNEQATKGLGNLFVAKELQLDPKDIIHVGDTMNDSTVVKHMNLIAVKNADRKLKAVAQYIGPSYKNGGIAKVLNGEYKEVAKK